jgi:hypothetical protein
MFDVPVAVWALVLAGVVGIPTMAGFALHRGAVNAGLGRRTASRVVAVAAVVWAGWIVTAGLLAARGAFRQEPASFRPWIGVAFAFALVVLLLTTRLPVVERILAQPGTPARLAWPHTLRVVGGAFLVVWLLGGLPAIFAVPAGLGDIAIGITAPLVARRLARGSGHSRAVWFNVLGIVDLAVAVSIGFLAGLGPSRLLHVTPSTEAVTLLPLALIPTTAVPLAIALHVVSLRRLRTPAVLSTGHRPIPTTA